MQNKVAKDDIVLRLNLSRTNVYMGEPIRASLTLYTRASIVGFEDVKLPSFNGFWSQELPVDNYKPQRETLDGKVYDSQIIKEYLLYPQQSGSLTIEPTDITAVARVVIQNARNFDPFFGGGVEEYNVKRKLTTGAITVKVNELPAGAPASFSGAVGEFTISAEMPPAQIKANSAATYTVKISGTGNLTFLQAPTLTLPSSFEAYSVRNTESIRSTTQGTTGYRQYEYPFIARAEGEYEIPPVEFSYFSPQKDAYVTLSTEALKMEVSPDASGGNQPAQVVTSTSKEDVRQLGSDIRFIKLTRPALRKSTAPLMLSGTYFVLLILIIAIFVALYFLLRKMIRDSKNTVLVRNRRANKVAVQRFRAAERFMRSGDRQAFYKEMLRAFWGYMSDKLNIPVADLTKESIREELLRRSERFARWYPRLIRGSVALGLAVPVALAALFALTPTEKVWLLTAWLVWLVAVFVFLVVVESLRASFERQLRLDAMSDEGLLELGAARNEMERAGDDPQDAEGGDGRA